MTGKTSPGHRSLVTGHVFSGYRGRQHADGLALIRRLLGYLRPYVWPYFVGAMVCMILFSSTNGVMPFLVRYIFDDIFTAKNAAVLQVLPFAIIARLHLPRPVRLRQHAT